MRGVYFKNMKWQAAIKVDKKQIHLGTVGSQEEAARLYDRQQAKVCIAFHEFLLSSVPRPMPYLFFHNILSAESLVQFFE